MAQNSVNHDVMPDETFQILSPSDDDDEFTYNNTQQYRNRAAPVN